MSHIQWKHRWCSKSCIFTQGWLFFAPIRSSGVKSSFPADEYNSESWTTCTKPQIPVFVLFFLNRGEISFFFFICDTIYRAQWKCAHTWKHHVAEDMQIEYTAERKAMFPNVIFFLGLSKHSGWVRSGVFMSAAPSSSEACFPAGRRFQWQFEGSFGLKSARSEKRESSALNITFIKLNNNLFMREKVRNNNYPHGPEVLKQLVSGRNTEKYRADSLTAQTPG